MRKQVISKEKSRLKNFQKALRKESVKNGSSLTGVIKTVHVYG